MANKRKRGAQPGNHNARKHGFYSPAISPEEISVAWKMVNVHSANPHTAVIRVKLASALRHDPANYRLLEDSAKLLTKMYLAKHSLDSFDTRQLRAMFLHALEVSHNMSPDSKTPAKQNEAIQAQTPKQNETKLLRLKPRRKTNRDCQAQTSKRNESRLILTPF
jgi:hypothetical protein